MAHELIHPNWHVILIHYPLALLTLGLLIELFSFLYRRSTLRTAGRWMLLLGALSCLPAATAGLYAFYDVVRFAGQGEVTMEPAGDAWYQLVRAAEPHLAPQQWDDLKHHVWREASGTIIIVITAIVFLGASDRWRKRLYVPCLLLAIFAVGVMMSGAWHVGESIYTRGTAVEHGASGPAIDTSHPNETIQQFIPPLQLHVVLAGLTIAMAVAALGLSIRAIASRPPLVFTPVSDETHDLVYSNPPALQVQMTVVAPPVYPARFWLLATLLGLLTLGAGVWMAELFSWEQIKPLLAQPRDLTHIILGSSILLLTLVLAALTRWAPGRKWTLGIFATLLLVAIAGQIWMGILLMYDGSDGGSSLFRFRAPTVQATTNPVAAR